MANEPRCNHSDEEWYRDQEGNIQCADCEDDCEDDINNKVMYKGSAVTLSVTPQDFGYGRNPRCCNKARTGNFYFCVCSSRSYCPDHGVQCNGSHD